MSQDFNLPAVADNRADALQKWNDALNALRGLHSGPTEPSNPVAYMLWADTTSGWLKQRDAANSAWLLRSRFAEVAASGTLAGVVNYTDEGTPISLGTLPDNHIVTDAGIYVEQAFIGSGGTHLMNVGYSGLTDAYLSAINVATNGAKQPNGSFMDFYSSTSREVLAQYDFSGGGSPTAGKARPWLRYIVVPA